MKNLKHLRRFAQKQTSMYALMVLFLIICGGHVKAQQVLLKPINVSQIPLLPTEKQTFWQNLGNLPYKKTLQLVKVGDLPNLQQNGFLSFTIPGINPTITATAVRVEYADEKDYIWQAKIAETGYMSIVSKPDGVSGFIQLNNKYFVLYPLYKSYSALFEYNIGAMPNDTCAQLATAAPSAIDYCAEDYVCFPTIDVLVLVTPEARNWIGGNFGSNWLNALSYVITGIETVNFAFANSNIPDKHIRTRYAAINDFTYSTQTEIPQISADINTLVASSTANSLRNQYKADLVVMLTNDRYANFAGVTADLGPNSARAYSIVEINALLDPRYTYAHEVGHLFGANHNRSANVPCNNGCGADDGDCQHGWRFNDANGVERRTTMALLPDADQLAGDQRILNYSNPDVLFNGTATGTANDNNAQIIRNSSCAVVGFKPSPEFSATISGYQSWCLPPHPDTEAPNTYSAVVTAATPGFAGTPPYTYQWRWNTSGIFNALDPGTVIGTASTVTIGYPLACPHFFLRLRITGSDGYTYTVTRKITTSLCGEGCPSGKANLSEQQTNPTDAWQVIPNPANSNCRLVADNVPNGNYFMQLSNAEGKTIEQRNIPVDDEYLNATLITDQLPNGIYTLTVIGNTTTICKKIIITH